MSTELQRAAKKYAEMGFAIFPLSVRGKTPLTKNGWKDATSDPMVILNWWEQWPNANIGLVTGRINGIVVIDLDIDEEKNLNGYDSLKSWQKEHGNFPHTLFSQTGRGGYHMLYHTRDVYKNRVGILPGIDIRADGGYIVAPPSIHPNGNTYEWKENADTMEIADADDVIKEFLAIGNGKKTDAQKMVMPDRVGEGKRNDTMFRLACSLQSRGLTDQAIYAACMKENENRFDPPLEQREVDTIVKSCTEHFLKGKPIVFDMSGQAIQGRREPELAVNRKGEVSQTIENAREAIEYDENLYGKIRYNELAYSPWLTGAVPWSRNPSNSREWTDFDDSGLKSYIETKYGLRSGAKCMDALNVVLESNRFNPVKERLREIHDKVWDGQKGHVENLLPVYLGAERCEYTTEAMRVFMLGAVCRAFYPGCKFDYMLVLVGAQGIGKSAFLRSLSIDSKWFNDNFNTVEGDKASEKLRGMWIVEMAELLAAKRQKEQESIKAFITSTVDTYRSPYGRRTEQRPRSCVFAGSTNESLFLSDPTGSRRFLPIVTSREMQEKDVFTHRKELEEEVLQCWGEIMEEFYASNGEPDLRIADDLIPKLEEIRESHSEEDPRVGVIQQWLDSNHKKSVCAVQLYMEALEHDRNDWTRKDINEIHQIMQNKIPGWKRAEHRSSCGRYGSQIVYVRQPDAPDTAADLPF